MGATCGCDRKRHATPDPFDRPGVNNVSRNAATSPMNKSISNMDKAPLLPPSSSISVSTTVTYSTNENITTTQPLPTPPSTSPNINGFDMDAKTMQLLMKIDDSFSPSKKTQQSTTTSNTDGAGSFPFSVSNTTTIQSGASTQSTQAGASPASLIPNNNSLAPTDVDGDIAGTSPSLSPSDRIMTQPPVKRITTDEKDLAPSTERIATITNVKTLQELANNIKESYDVTISDNDTPNEESSGDDHSELDEAEMKEIERLKSEVTTKGKGKGKGKTKVKGTKDSARKQTLTKPKISMGSKVYRQGTATAWEVDDMEDMHREMSQQLQTLAQQVSGVEISELQKTQQLSEDIFVPPKLGLGSGSAGSNNKDGNIGLNDLGSLGMGGDDDDIDELQLPDSNLYRDGSKDQWNEPKIERQKQEMKKQMMHLVQQSLQISEMEPTIMEEEEVTDAQ